MATVTRTGNTDRTSAARELTDVGLDVIVWEDTPGIEYPEHAHPAREVRHVLAGTMTVGTPEGVHELGPGDRIELAPGERHRARAGDGGVTYLSASADRPGETRSYGS